MKTKRVVVLAEKLNANRAVDWGLADEAVPRRQDGGERSGNSTPCCFTAAKRYSVVQNGD